MAPASSLLDHLAEGHQTDGPAALLHTLETAENLATACWAAAGIEQHVFCDPEALPPDTARVLIDSFAGLRGRGKPMPGACREVASPILCALAELVRIRKEDHCLLRDRLLDEAFAKDLEWLQAWFELMAVPVDFRPSHGRKSTDVKPSQITPVSAEEAALGSGAFAHACQVLEIVVRGDEELTSALHKHEILPAIGAYLVRETTPAKDAALTSWLPRAASAVSLIDALVEAEDVECLNIQNPELFRPVWSCYHRPEAATTGCLAALQRSLEQDAFMGVSQLQLSALRALGNLAQLSNGQAARVFQSKAPEWAGQLLSRVGNDEEATVTALDFLFHVSAKAPHRLSNEALAAAKGAGMKFQTRNAVQQRVAKVLAACSVK